MHAMTVTLARMLIGEMAMFSLMTVEAHGAKPSAEVRTIGTGEGLEIDPASVPPSLQEGYTLMKRACVSCHGQARLLLPIQLCRDKKHDEEQCVRDIKVPVMRMLRRPGVNLSRQEGKILIDFFLQLRDMQLP